MNRDILYMKTPTGYTEWVRPILRGFSLSCCDCGLAHDFEFRVLKDGKVLRGVDIEFRVRRDYRTTGQLRRHRRLPKVVACCYCGREQ